jgi:hypothetical protein
MEGLTLSNTLPTMVHSQAFCIITRHPLSRGLPLLPTGDVLSSSENLHQYPVFYCENCMYSLTMLQVGPFFFMKMKQSSSLLQKKV